MLSLLLIVTTLYLYPLCYGWEAVREERMPLELRVVNEGVAHDENNWYFSNKHFLYKTKVFPLEIELTNYDAIPKELRQMSYNHIGDIDIDIDNGIIYGGLEGDNGISALATWNTTDLSMVSYKVTSVNGMPWVAIDPSNRYIYTALWNACCNLDIYDMDSFDYIKSVNIPSGLPNEIQGGAFYEGELYLCSNLEDAVYKVNVTTGDISFVLSDSYDHHDYEMEGIDFFDLTKYGLGFMHLFGNFMTAREKSLRSYKP